jgi:hypothetical protein
VDTLIIVVLITLDAVSRLLERLRRFALTLALVMLGQLVAWALGHTQ